jgi:hypothetical protein
MNEIVDVVEFLVQSAAVLSEGAKSKWGSCYIQCVLPSPMRLCL